MHLKFFKVNDINLNLSFNNDRALLIAKAGNHIHKKNTVVHKKAYKWVILPGIQEI